jgi:hypothetical protein
MIDSNEPKLLTYDREITSIDDGITTREPPPTSRIPFIDSKHKDTDARPKPESIKFENIFFSTVS